MKMSNMRNLCLILLGNTVYALAIVMFILPNDIITGGTTGLGIAVNHYFGLQIHTFVLIFNTLMFLLGAAVLGMKFALTTLVSTFYYPIIWEYWRMFQYYRTSQTIRCFQRSVEV